MIDPKVAAQARIHAIEGVGSTRRGHQRCKVRSCGVIDPEQIVALYYQRRMKRQPMMDKRLKVLEQYNGETKVDMPELDQTEQTRGGQSPGVGTRPVRPAHRLGAARHPLPEPAARDLERGTARPETPGEPTWAGGR